MQNIDQKPNKMEENPQPILDTRIKGRKGYGLIQVFTGNGKGKTTAALGELIRCIGAGKKAAIVFFDKGGTHYSERSILERLDVPWFAYGRDRIDSQTGKFDFTITDEDRDLAKEGLIKAEELLTSELYDFVVLDEVNSCTNLDIMSVDQVLIVLDKKLERTEVVLTGRNAPNAFLEHAHLVTNMTLQKHYFYSGVPAREGIDF